MPSKKYALIVSCLQLLLLTTQSMAASGLAAPLTATTKIEGPYRNSAAAIAQAFGVSLAKAQEARREDLDEILVWSLLLMDQRCNCGIPELMRRRATLGWGELARSANWAWADLMDAIFSRAKAAGIQWTAPDNTQLQRSSSNRPDELIQRAKATGDAKVGGHDKGAGQ